MQIRAKMFDQTSTSVPSLNNITSFLVSEKFAIVTCGLLIAVFALPMLIVMQMISAVTGGTVTIWQLLNGKGLFKNGDEL